MKKYARGDGRMGIESFAGKMEEFRKYLSERRGFVEWSFDTLYRFHYTPVKGGKQCIVMHEKEQD
jgi:hypothetical protein